MSVKEDQKKENEDPEVAMQELLTAHGEFRIESNGTLNWEDFKVLIAITYRQGLRTFYKEEKRALFEKKLVFYQAEDWPGYMKQYLENQNAFSRAATDMVKKGCDWVKISGEIYRASSAFYFNTSPDHVEDVQENQKIILAIKQRLQHETEPLKDTKETIVKALKRKLQLDHEKNKLITMFSKSMPIQRLNGIRNLENDKVGCKIFLEFGFTVEYLQEGIIHFQLNKDKEIANFQQLIQLQEESNKQKFMESCTLGDEQLTAMKNECSALGKPDLKADGTMSFDYFLDSQKVILRYVHEHSKEELRKKAVARREIMSSDEGYETAFAKAVTECSNYEAGCL